MVSFWRLFVEEDEIEGDSCKDVKMKYYCTTFFKETSMAGFPQLVKQPGIFKKIFWFLSIVAMGVGLWWECDLFFAKFLAFQSSTSVTVQTSRSLYFPAITLCNNNAVNWEWYNATWYNQENQPTTSGGGGSGGPAPAPSGGPAPAPSSGPAPAPSSGPAPAPSGGPAPAPSGSGTETTTASGAPGPAPAPAPAPAPTAASGTTAGAAVTTAPPPPPGPPGPAPGRKRREVPPKPDEDLLLNREKRAGGILASRTGPGPQQGPGAGAAQIRIAPMPSYSESMQTQLNIQQKAASAEYIDRVKAGHQLCDMVLKCEYGGEACDIESNFNQWHWNAQYGNCWTFNGGYLQPESKVYGTLPTDTLWTIKIGGSNDSGVRISKLPGDTYGLYLLLNADTDHYLPYTTQLGWRIAIHNQTEMPFPEETGFFISTGTSTRVGLALNYIEKLGSVPNFLYTAKYSDCVSRDTYTPDDPDNAYSKIMEVAYTTAACYKTCYQRIVMQNCSCFDFLYPSQGSAFSTSGTNTLPPCDYLNTTQWQCRETVLSLHQGDALGCGDICPENCKAYSFETSISALRWPNPSKSSMQLLCAKILNVLNNRIARADSTCNSSSNIAEMVAKKIPYKLLDDLTGCASGTFHDPIASWYELADYIIGNQFAEVYIYYKDFNYQTVVDGEWLELPDFLAYMGGILGLFFGFTFMTMMEYIQLFFDLIFIGIGKLCCKNNKTGDVPHEPLKTDPTSLGSFGKPESGSHVIKGYPVDSADLYGYSKPATASHGNPFHQTNPVPAPYSSVPQDGTQNQYDANAYAAAYYGQPPDAYGLQQYPYPTPPE